VAAQKPAAAKAKDARLVAAISAAAGKRITPDKVEAAVGTRATLNTFRKEDRLVLSHVDIVPDPDRQPPLPASDTIRWVAYWIRPIGSRNPKVVGICWPKDGRPQVFFGEVLPPG